MDDGYKIAVGMLQAHFKDMFIDEQGNRSWKKDYSEVIKCKHCDKETTCHINMEKEQKLPKLKTKRLVKYYTCSVCNKPGYYTTPITWWD